MKDPWTCSECGREMIRAFSCSDYLTCPKGHGRLHIAPRIKDLPLASRAICRNTLSSNGVFPFTRLFWISGRPGLWKYIPHAHKTALDKRSEPGVVIAAVVSHHRYEVRAFRRAGRQPTGA